MEQPSPAYVRQLARDLRRRPTAAEKALWGRLRNRQLAGAKFRRQHPIGRYIVDFYCREVPLVVELYGDVHDKPGQKEYDRERLAEIEGTGAKVLVFANEEVFSNLDGVLGAIAKAVNSG